MYYHYSTSKVTAPQDAHGRLVLQVCLGHTLCRRGRVWAFSVQSVIGLRGSHLCVTSWSVCDQDQDFWPAKSVFNWLLGCSLLKLLITWFSMGQRSNCSWVFWFLQFRDYLDSIFFILVAMLLHRTFKWPPLVYRGELANSSNLSPWICLHTFNHATILSEITD